jgi:hypothetical protein
MHQLKFVSLVTLFLISSSTLGWSAYYSDSFSEQYNDAGYKTTARLFLDNGEIVEGSFIIDSSFLWVNDQETGVAYRLYFSDVSWFERHGRQAMTIATTSGKIIEATSTSSWKSGYSLYVYGILDDRELNKGLEQSGLASYVVNLDRKNNHPSGLKYIKRVEFIGSGVGDEQLKLEGEGSEEFRLLENYPKSPK